MHKLHFFLNKMHILCLFLKNILPSNRVVRFILNNLHFPMMEGIAFYALYKARVHFMHYAFYLEKNAILCLLCIFFLIKGLFFGRNENTICVMKLTLKYIFRYSCNLGDISSLVAILTK